MIDLAKARDAMIERTIVARGLDDPALIAAFRAVPREEFIAPAQRVDAYGDFPLPIGSGQTISQPYIVALMIDAARIGKGDRVLEIGAGSGYAAAVIGQLASEVIAIERHHDLAEAAAGRVARLGYSNVHVVEGDGSAGYPAGAPFDAIIASAAGRQVADALVGQLAEGGRIVMPVGEPQAVQALVKLTKRSDGTLTCEELGAVRFVPLVEGTPGAPAV